MDVLFLHHTIAATLDQKGHSVQLLFAFEYIILASTAAATLLKYLLSMLDTAMEGRWEGKGTYVFYLELLKDMMHLFVYCIFFVIVFTNYGLPLHLVSPTAVGVAVVLTVQPPAGGSCCCCPDRQAWRQCQHSTHALLRRHAPTDAPAAYVQRAVPAPHASCSRACCR